MNVSSNPEATSGPAVPEGFRPLPFTPRGSFVDVNGPLYGKRDNNELVIGFRVELRHCNPAQICHGGMLMAVADMILGAGSNYNLKLKRFLPTVSMTSDFMAPAPLGAWVEGRAQVLRTTRNLVFTQCLLTADGVPAMRASGIMKLGMPFEELAAKFDLQKSTAG